MGPLKPFNKILVATDFSEGAHRALERALEIRQRYGGTVTLLHVYQLPVGPTGLVFSADLTATLEQAARSEMELHKKWADREGGADVEIKVTLGVPHKEIIHEAQDYDLIVMGTHGRSGIKHLFIGSVAERVVRMAPCPVLVVPEPATRR